MRGVSSKSPHAGSLLAGTCQHTRPMHEEKQHPAPHIFMHLVTKAPNKPNMHHLKSSCTIIRAQGDDSCCCHPPHPHSCPPACQQDMQGARLPGGLDGHSQVLEVRQRSAADMLDRHEACTATFPPEHLDAPRGQAGTTPSSGLRRAVAKDLGLIALFLHEDCTCEACSMTACMRRGRSGRVHGRRAMPTRRLRATAPAKWPRLARVTGNDCRERRRVGSPGN